MHVLPMHYIYIICEWPLRVVIFAFTRIDSLFYHYHCWLTAKFLSSLHLALAFHFHAKVCVPRVEMVLMPTPKKKKTFITLEIFLIWSTLSPPSNVYSTCKTLFNRGKFHGYFGVMDSQGIFPRSVLLKDHVLITDRLWISVCFSCCGAVILKKYF